MIRVTTEPQYEPVSLAAVKRQAGIIDDGTNDDLFQLQAHAAREMVESDSRRAMMTQTCKLYLDRFPCGGDPIELEKPPIQSVTSVEYYDTTNALQTWSSSLWVADVYSEPGYISPVYGQVYPLTYARKGAVIVTFICGWTDPTLVPARARQAILMLAAYWCQNHEAAGEGMVKEKPLAYEDLVRRIKWGPDA